MNSKELLGLVDECWEDMFFWAALADCLEEEGLPDNGVARRLAGGEYVFVVDGRRFCEEDVRYELIGGREKPFPDFGGRVPDVRYIPQEREDPTGHARYCDALRPYVGRFRLYDRSPLACFRRAAGWSVW